MEQYEYGIKTLHEHRASLKQKARFSDLLLLLLLLYFQRPCAHVGPVNDVISQSHMREFQS